MARALLTYMVMSVTQPRAQNHERREHARKPANLAVEVYAYCKDSNIYHESTCLRDFSDGGISFVTQALDNYYIGQRVKFHLLDDQTLADKNTLRASGFVAWLQAETAGEAAWIGICMGDDVFIS